MFVEEFGQLHLSSWNQLKQKTTKCHTLQKCVVNDPLVKRSKNRADWEKSIEEQVGRRRIRK